MLAYSSVAQAGYMLAGVVVSTRLGVQATRLLPRRLRVDEPGRVRGDHRARARDRARRRHLVAVRARARRGRWLAWPMTIAMLALAGFPATAGFFGKLYLIEAAVDNGYAWLGVVIVLGSAVSLAYYLRVVAAVWMRSPAEAPRRAAAPAPRARDRGRLGRGRRRGRAAGREPGARGRVAARRREVVASRSARRPRGRGCAARGDLRRGRLRGWRRCSSGSTPSRCSTSPATPAARCTRLL